VFHLHGQDINFPIFVAEIPDDCLLGADILSIFKCFLSITDYSVHLTLPDGSSTVLHCCGSSPSTESRRLVRTIRTTDVFQVGARQEVVLVSSISAGRGHWTYQIAPFPDQRPSDRLPRARSMPTLIARSDCDGLAEEIPIHLINPTNRPWHLPRGTALAELSVIPRPPPELPQVILPSQSEINVGSTVAEDAHHWNWDYH